MKRWAYALVASLTLMGCSRYPSGVLHPEDMASLMADIHIAEALAEQHPGEYSGDSAKMALKQSVYLRHGVTSADVDSTMAWYGRNMEIYIKVYEQVVDTLKVRQAGARQLVSAALGSRNVKFGEVEVQQGDTVDIWPGHRVYELSERLGMLYFGENMTPQPGWEAGDRFELRMRLNKLYSPVDIVIGADYADGTHALATHTVVNDGMNVMAFDLDPDKRPTALYVAAGGSAPLKGRSLVIDSISLRRIHIRRNR